MKKDFIKFYEGIQSLMEYRFLFQVLDFIMASGVCPKSDQDHWIKTLSFMHCKDWIYYHYEDGKLVTVIGAYRIKTFDKNIIDVLPEEQEGDILYIPFNVSVATDLFIMKKMLSSYLKENHSIKEIIFYERNSDEKIKRFKIKGDRANVKGESSKFAEPPNVSK